MIELLNDFIHTPQCFIFLTMVTIIFLIPKVFGFDLK